MNWHQGDSTKSASAFRVARWVFLASFSTFFLAAAVAAAPSANSPRDREGIAALRHAPQPEDIPTPNQRITVALPVATLDNSVPIDAVRLMPVNTTNLDVNRRFVGFQGDFVFDETVVTFSFPYVEAAGLTATGWSVAANILNGTGTTKILRVSGFSPDLTPISGTGLLYNLRVLRVSSTPATYSTLVWRLYPNAFEYIDDQLNEIIPNQPNGLITITGTGPTATPSPVPVPTPCMPLSQGFDDIYTLVQDYWVFRNNSEPLGETIWFQGDGTVFPAHSGIPDSYIGANFQNGADLATISNWLITPPVNLHDGARLTFYTRTVAVRDRPDRLQVRMSTNGSSSDVGTTATSVGDFTNLLLDINPDYTMTGYPNIWTQYSVVVSGLGSRTIGRMALRYFVENAGPGGQNSNWIGIDSLEFTSCDYPTPSPVPATPTPTPGEVCPPVITESVSQSIIAGNSVACIGPPPFHYHFDNSYWRAFDMLPITAGDPYFVTSVSFGIEVARSNPDVGTQPVVVRLHRQMSGGFPEGNRTLLVETSLDLTDQAEIVLNVPLQVIVPAGTNQLIMEVFTPDGQAPANNSFFIGSNADGQSAPSYLSTQACEYPQPIDLSLLGFPGMNTVFNINGTCDLPTPTPSPTPVTYAKNLSTRMRVGAGDNAGIAGFIITGSGAKPVLLRGIGPSLGAVQQPLADPVLELHGPSGFSTVINNNWRDTQEAEITATGLAPANDSESAILVSLQPGAYTAILSGHNGGTGMGLVEVYDVSHGTNGRLANISTRGFVDNGNDIIIAGFILGGGGGDNIIWLRGIGPSLAQSGVMNALTNPKLELRSSDGTVVASNDDWQNGPPITEPPGNPLESAIDVTLAPGAYTALLSGVNNGTGIGLVEIYDRGAP